MQVPAWGDTSASELCESEKVCMLAQEAACGSESVRVLGRQRAHLLAQLARIAAWGLAQQMQVERTFVPAKVCTPPLVPQMLQPAKA